jgi:hypothetical protein
MAFRTTAGNQPVAIPPHKSPSIYESEVDECLATMALLIKNLLATGWNTGYLR